MALDLARRRVTVNAVCPGVIDTPMLAGFNDHATPAERRRMEKPHMLERFGKPEELIGATILLASNTAGSFITGHEMVVDGGFNAMTL